MTIQHVETIFKFFGGLGMFIYGMNVMADGLQKTAGNKMKQLLGFLTNNRFLAVLVGALVTAIIQSSSATTVMVVGFVNAGLVNLGQAVGVIMGANIGTTITSWLVSLNEWQWGQMLKPEFLAPLFIGIGAFTMMFAKKERKKEVGEILVGFGVLFIGLSFMSGAIKPYSSSPVFLNAFRVLGKNPILGIATGAIVTAIIQSSSASVGILQTLALSGMVTWNSAVYITLGQNIGTCITAILSSTGANKTAKRAAAIHLIFNMLGAVIFGVIMFAIFAFNSQFAGARINSVQISIFHTVFNITNTILLFPFANALVKLSGMIIKDSDENVSEDDEVKLALNHLDNRILESPSFAVENVVKEVVHVGEVTLDNAKLAVESMLENDKEKAAKVFETEKTIDKLVKIITEYLVKISNLSITEKQSIVVNHMFYTISNIERVGDHAENMAELAVEKIDHSISFSSDAQKEMKDLCEVAIKSFENAIEARKTENVEYIRNVVKLEDMVDTLEDDLREKHIQRLSQNKCNSESGVIFIDALTNLERISDHSLNIANYVKDEM
ncbi:sodium-dependent phosphate transporter [Lachnospiraceae bacterium KM106-2]|nr:sodium-dependent phosphate transporter [Lachnospiraceae bacterium KM106-2]